MYYYFEKQNPVLCVIFPCNEISLGKYLLYFILYVSEYMWQLLGLPYTSTPKKLQKMGVA